MNQHIGGTVALLGLLLCLCESDNLITYIACGCFGVALMAVGAGISGVYITKEDKIHE